MFSVLVEERWGPGLTIWGLFDSKFLIQGQVVGGSPRSDNLQTRMSRMIVLNAEL